MPRSTSESHNKKNDVKNKTAKKKKTVKKQRRVGKNRLVAEQIKEILGNETQGLARLKVVERLNEWSKAQEHKISEADINNGFNLLSQETNEYDVERTARGIYKLRNVTHDIPITNKFKESDLEEPLALFARTNISDIKEACSVGTARRGKKFANPDVIGITKANPGARLKFPPQIHAFEIKKDAKHALEAFGQAVAYRLFASKSYIVLPEVALTDDLDRISSLCSLHGIGLITYNEKEGVSNNMKFSIISNAVRQDTDPFWVDDFVTKLVESDEKWYKFVGLA